MFSMKKEKERRSSPKRNIAFYVSLGLCIAAVAGAAWNTYGSIDEYAQGTNGAEESSQQSEKEAALEAAREVRDQKYEASRSESAVPEVSLVSRENDNSKQTGSSKQESSEAPASTAKVCRPIEKGDVIKAYSPKDPVRSETMNDWRTHEGVDISAGEGSPVHAVLSGRVKSLYNDPLYGNVIVIESSGGYVLRYCGVTNTSIAKEGSTVTAGETIGYIGIIPSESKDESHLHLEATISGEPADPTILF